MNLIILLLTTLSINFPHTINFLKSNNDLTYFRKNSDFPITYNSRIKEYINFYTKKAKKYYEKTIGKSELYKPKIIKILSEYELPRELFLLPFIESGYNETAISSAKAQGLWQLMPLTAVSLGSKVDVFLDERRNYEKSTKHAAKFLKELYDKYNDWYLTLAAYNCGPGCVDKELKKTEPKIFGNWKNHFPPKLKTM